VQDQHQRPLARQPAHQSRRVEQVLAVEAVVRELLGLQSHELRVGSRTGQYRQPES